VVTIRDPSLIEMRPFVGVLLILSLSAVAEIRVNLCVLRCKDNHMREMDNEWSTDFTLPLLNLLRTTGNETAAYLKAKLICESNTNLEECLHRCNKSQETAILLAGIKSWQDACEHLEVTMTNSQHVSPKNMENYVDIDQKLYLTTTEWKEIGGHKDDTGTRLQRAQFKRLPLTHCSLSLIPFEDPVCTRSGEIFDLTHIIPYLKKNGVNPCTGKKLSSKDLIHLKFDKDEQGRFRCPVTFRGFTDHTHVVAIATTGNVFSYEAVQ
ncbi:hypothetical protein TELCIR_11646, partial [Teladorsagia circumcincta]